MLESYLLIPVRGLLGMSKGVSRLLNVSSRGGSRSRSRRLCIVLQVHLAFIRKTKNRNQGIRSMEVTNGKFSSDDCHDDKEHLNGSYQRRVLLGTTELGATATLSMDIFLCVVCVCVCVFVFDYFWMYGGS